LLLALATSATSSRAVAQQKRPTAVLFNSAGAPSGSPLDSIVQGSLEELGVVDITSRPGMDLGGVQLALDCVAETTHCLNAVATQSGVDTLIAPTLQKTPTELVLSILRFDNRGNGRMKRVVRRQSGHILGGELLDAVPNMLRELFDLPPKQAPTATPPSEQPTELPGPDQPPPVSALTYGDEAPSWRMPAGPLILAGVGVLAIGGGVVSGVLMKSKQQDFNQLDVTTRDDASFAADTRSAGKTQAVVANILFGVGGAAVIAAGIWLLVDHANYASRVESSQSTTSLQPIMGPQQLGLVLTHRGSAL
jgi:hypothetical protein